MTIKLTFIAKIFMATLAVISLGAIVGTASVSAQAAPPPTSTTGSDAQCQGDFKTCVPAASDPAATGCATNDCNIFYKYLNPLIRLLTVMVGISVVVGIIIGGIQYSASAGDPQKAANAKRHIRNAIIALVAFFFLYAFLKFLTPGSGIFTT